MISLPKIPIVDIVEGLVQNVSTRITPQLQAFDALITGVNYEHGHPLEIIETMNQKDESETFVYDKYPLVALFQDFPEDDETFGVEGVASLHLIIARATNPDYKATERYAENFNPILQPIYEMLMQEFCYSPYFMEYSVTKIKRTKIDRLYWGREGLWKNEKNVFNDFIDCIELKLQLKLSRSTC